MRFYILLLIYFAALTPVEHLYANDSEMCVIAQDAISAASRIRGLKKKKKVPCEVHNKEKVRKYILGAIEEQAPQKKLEMEELVYREIGMIPRDFNYQEGLIDLYLSQLGGYYDPKKDYFVMAGWLPAVMQNTIAVHELTHALQDQYFELEPFIDSKKFSTDQILARMALVEGDATAVMMDYTRELVGQGPLSEAQDVEGIMMQNVLSVALVAGVAEIPQSLRTILIFPYTSGLRFAHELLKKGGYQRVNKAFKAPPQTTEQVLHPEKYLSLSSDFALIQDSELKAWAEGSQKVLHSDTLGEFSVSSLLGMFVGSGGEAAIAAAGWAGDRIVVFENEDSQKRTVVWKLLWDSAEDADEFFSAYSKVIEKREESVKRKSKNALSSPSGISLEKFGSTVVFISKVG